MAGNRDEFHARTASPLGVWVDEPSIIAGRDMLSQGTWMGVSSTGRFGVVTNVRNPGGPDPQKESRGALVTNWLAEAQVPDKMDRFNPFNLLIGDQKGVQFVSNRPTDLSVLIDDGIHGMSNAVMDEHWPRKDRLNLEIENWLHGQADDPVDLFNVLIDTRSKDDDDHPVFIRNPVYGTRCSTILAVGHDGCGRIIERRFDADGNPAGESAVAFHWPA
ncbi:NRDE family protein [Sphingorhabdus sp.]|uniref:NRDE family protein n=1 Tax=Sphingorhabdus sp. TaxID=1902408 RepID=UPI00391A7269